MLVSVRWLEELLGLDESGKQLDGEQVAAALTSLGLEVDGVTQHGAGLDVLVVGEVKAKGPHPKADRLSLVELFDGKDTLAVVCGANNVPDPGGKVAFAPVGAKLPNGLELVEREIRGAKSHGMICSEDEIDIGTNHDGIIVLQSDWSAGERLIERVPGIVDTVIEISLTPNRPDALGHVGIARDLALKLGFEWNPPTRMQPEVPTDASLVEIQAPDRCGRYYGYTLAGATIGPAPLWMRVRLHRVGLRPINNAVDVTNFVLMEWGQPLHAFDRAQLHEGRVVVRMAQGEKMTTLDEAEIELSEDDLVIADAARPQALAGVMGGAGSMVEENANELLLEAAWFSPLPIRRTGRRHGLHTDSSHRFERGVDHGWGLEQASLRAAELLCELTGATVSSRCLAKGTVPTAPTIRLRPARVEHILGMRVEATESARILRGLEIEVDDTDGTAFSCVPPTHRPDLQLEEDLIEEVMRHHGLEDLPATASIPTELHVIPMDEMAQRGERVIDALVECGVHETVSFAFTDPAKLAPFEAEFAKHRQVRVSNPMRVQQSVMRTHLLPGLLDAVALNAARHSRPLSLFELGRIYAWPAGAPGPRPGAGEATAKADARLPDELVRAGIVVAGARHGAQDVVGALTHVLRRVGLQPTVQAASKNSSATYLHPGVQSRITVGDDTTVGVAGEIHPDLRGQWDLPEDLRVYYGELRIDAMPPSRVGEYTEIPRFPSTSRDLSLDLQETISAGAVVRHLRDAAVAVSDKTEDAPRLAPGDDSTESICVLEEWRGEGIGDGRRALLLRLHYRAAGRSVTDAEVQTLHDHIVTRACEALSATDPQVRKR
jgi:phenylalanyl-tRNA synthetase beta chain